MTVSVCPGVFGDVVVTVMEGDSVTLHADTKIQIKEIDWRFGEKLIAEIDIETSYSWYDEASKDRLKLYNQTGDLKITNIRISDAGSYNLQVNSEQPPSKKFTVKGECVSLVYLIIIPQLFIITL